ncbi:MAG TPA: transcriptional repressor [Firmicutes bacterium]|nr:transcriptional repressor [Bacillota bacterium]
MEIKGIIVENITQAQVAGYLKENGIKPSLIRVKVMKYLMDHRNHPTADEIYKRLLEEIPTLSRTSVYNALNGFVKKSIVNELTIEEKYSRYDALTDTHAHFKCRKCGSVYDITQESKNCGSSELEGFCVEEKHIYLKGKCASCVKKGGNNGKT